MTEKKKIFVISDHPLSPSGVGTQTRYMIEALISTGKYSFVCFGGAVKHNDYTPTQVGNFGEDWVIYPVDGYGTPDKVRSIVHTEKPDMLWFMTDPRFFGWLWEIEDEIRPNVPMVYYHVWDNYPYPTYNEKFYASNDAVVCISKVTHDILQNVAPKTESIYLPHSVNTDIFKKLDEKLVKEFKQEHFRNASDKFVFFWNNRNARRKQSGSLIFWFNDFLNKVGKDKAVLLMHTEVRDQHGQDLEAIIHELGLTNGEVMFSEEKVPPQQLAVAYNMADCTINVADAEGFGLATFESLACETPIIVTMTGGLQEQVTDGENWFGVGIEPASKAIIGSQDIPWIYEDRVSGKDVVDAMVKIYEMNKKERDKLGEMGRKHVNTNYNFSEYGDKWDQVITYLMDKHGSWEARKNYKSWELIEV